MALAKQDPYQLASQSLVGSSRSDRLGRAAVASPTIRDVSAVLEGVRLKGETEAMARCPAHEDQVPSLKLSQHPDKLLMHCFGGCSYREVREALEKRGVRFPRAKSEKFPGRPRKQSGSRDDGVNWGDRDEVPFDWSVLRDLVPVGTPEGLVNAVLTLTNPVGHVELGDVHRTATMMAACPSWAAMPDASKAQVLSGLKRRVGDLATAEALLGGSIDRSTRRWVPLPGLDTVGDEGPPWRSLIDAEAASAWTSVGHGVAYVGKLTLLVGRPKDGKSTIAAGVCAGVVSGSDWLTHVDLGGRRSVLWVAGPTESDTGELRSMLAAAGADDEGVKLAQYMPVRPSESLVSALEKHPIPDLGVVVVDSMRSLLSTTGGREDSSDDVQRAMAPLAGLCKRTDVPVIVIHHARRSMEAMPGDRTRGSGDLLASADLIVEMMKTTEGAGISYSSRGAGPDQAMGLDWRYVKGRFGRYTLRRAAPPADPGPCGGSGDYLDPDSPDVHPPVLQKDAEKIHGYLMQAGPLISGKTAEGVKMKGRAWPRFAAAVRYLIESRRVVKQSSKRGGTILAAVPGGSGSSSRSTGSIGSAPKGGGTGNQIGQFQAVTPMEPGMEPLAEPGTGTTQAEPLAEPVAAMDSAAEAGPKVARMDGRMRTVEAMIAFVRRVRAVGRHRRSGRSTGRKWRLCETRRTAESFRPRRPSPGKALGGALRRIRSRSTLGEHPATRVP